MKIRRVQHLDIPEISDLYGMCFGIQLNEYIYNWYYYGKENYLSYVMLDSERIIAHQAIIENAYSYRGKKLKVGLLSGTMILPEYRNNGDFYYLLRECLSEFKGDIVIGFPNNNFQGIMQKVFKFNVIHNNSYRLDLSKRVKPIENQFLPEFKLLDLTRRIDNHPIYCYQIAKKGKCNIIYKEYLNDSIDVISSNIINNDFVEILKEFSKKHSSINIISERGDLLEQIGFEKTNGNEFVYKAFNREYAFVPFSCQMIDSDIY